MKNFSISTFSLSLRPGKRTGRQVGKQAGEQFFRPGKFGRETDRENRPGKMYNNLKMKERELCAAMQMRSRLYITLIAAALFLTACFHGKTDKSQDNFTPLPQSTQKIIASPREETNNFEKLLHTNDFEVIKLLGDKRLKIDFNAQFTDEIAKSKRPTVIFGVTNWSEAAHKYLPVILDLSKNYSNDVDFFVINVEKTVDFTEKYKIKTVPVLLLFQQEKLVWEKTEEWDNLSPDLNSELRQLLHKQN